MALGNWNAPTHLLLEVRWAVALLACLLVFYLKTVTYLMYQTLHTCGLFCCSAIHTLLRSAWRKKFAMLRSTRQASDWHSSWQTQTAASALFSLQCVGPVSQTNIISVSRFLFCFWPRNCRDQRDYVIPKISGFIFGSVISVIGVIMWFQNFFVLAPWLVWF